MYLTELYRFYERMTQDPQSGMPPEGMSAEAIHFALVIGEDGSLKGVHDLRDSKGKPLRRFVPAAVSRSSNVAANFLWDKTSYVLGIDGRDDSCPSPEKRQAFLALHHERFDACPDRHAKALLAFLDHWRPEMLHSLPERQALLGSRLVFQLEGEDRFLHEEPAMDAGPATGSAEISFALVIAEDGCLRSVRDLRDSKGKPRKMSVPAARRRKKELLPNMLWDDAAYVLGVDGKDDTRPSPETAAAFHALHRKLLQDADDRHARALLAFLDRWQPEMLQNLPERQALLDSNLVFRLQGEEGFLHEHPALQRIWLDNLDGQECPQGQCLVTGREGPILKVHPVIKGVIGAQTSGARLISFTCNSFQSFGKEQSENAPVSPRAAYGYTTALNYLLQKEHGQVVHLSEDSIVFWTDRACAEESLLGALFDGLDATEQTQDSALLHKVRSLLTAMACGRPVSEDDGIDTSVRFFVLGLAPNAARLGVRLWVTDTFGNLLQRFGRWYRDLAIERPNGSTPKYPSLKQILLDLAPKKKSRQDSVSATNKNNHDRKDASPPKIKQTFTALGGQLLRSILLGRAWPQSMYTAALQRIHADKNVTFYRAALIKAHLCDTTAKGATMSLDKEEQNKGYRLGRLFAVLEKAQTDALGSVNASLRERYIGAASTRPCLVFPQLLKTAQFHISKSAKQHPGYDIRFSRLVSEIMDGMTVFPPVLSLEDQGRFMLGYYHQNNALYQKKTADDAEN